VFSLCLFYLHLSFRDLFIFAEYELLTAVLVDTELQGNYLFWGMTHSAKTAQLLRACKSHDESRARSHGGDFPGSCGQRFSLVAGR